MKLSIPLVALVQTIGLASSFTARPAGRVMVSSSSSSSSSLAAVIYHPSWEDDDAAVQGVDEDYFAQGAAHHDQLIQSILQRDPSQAALARLAAAFSPPERKIQLNNIDSVQLLAVDQDHINLEAILCENDGCVSLAVPVQFPVSCGSADSLQDCVLDNLGRLHDRATTQLDQVVWETDNYEQVQAVDRQMNELAVDDLEQEQVPTWWVKPDTLLEDECRLLKGILNEADFRPDLQGLAVALAVEQIAENINDVTAAAVVRVGSAGMILRISYPALNSFGDVVHNNRKLLTVQFSSSSSSSISSPSALREAVMDTLESPPTPAVVHEGLNLSFLEQGGPSASSS